MRIEFDLLSNATDSIERAIELAAWADEQSVGRRLKQSVQAIAHGVELLLKERLRRIHPSLLWENVDKYPSLNARTVTAEGAMSRLVNIGGVTFSREDTELIRSLRSTRNAIEHYTWISTKPEAELIVGEGLAFALEFSLCHLAHSFFGYRTRRDDTYENLLNTNQPFAGAIERRSRTSTTAPSVGETSCSFCRAVAVSSFTGACRICGHWESVAPFVDGSEDDIPF